MGVEAEVSEIDLNKAWSLRGPSDVVRVENGRAETGRTETGRDKVTSLGQHAPRGLVPTSQVGEAPSSSVVPASSPQHVQRRDWAAALTLVQEAAEAIRLSEERVEGLRREADDQVQQHHADLTALHGQLLAAQREIEAANQRARAAEQRAADANEWLARLDDAITAHFGGVGRAS